MVKRLHAIVEGRVQGVSFRYYTIRQAQALDLTGWVRNTPNRTVEVLAEGEQAQLEKFYAFLKIGSPAAQVSHVHITWSDASTEFDDFVVRYHNL